jgi:hypothetical protein
MFDMGFHGGDCDKHHFLECKAESDGRSLPKFRRDICLDLQSKKVISKMPAENDALLAGYFGAADGDSMLF